MRKGLLIIPLVFVLACRLTINTPLTTSGTASAEARPSVPADEGISGTVVPVPSGSIQIEGIPYKTYQLPGDPFRIVCQEPCRLDERFLLAEYAGFRSAHAELIRLTGVDALAELQPVDMHVELTDSVCAELPGGHAYVYSDAHRAYTCTEGPGFYPALEERIQKAARPEEQYFPLHEYMHTLFFGRLSGEAGDFYEPRAAWMHDFVVPLPSYATGGLDPAEFCTYRFEIPPGDYNGWLINELCRRNGFTLADLALSLIELDTEYESGAGQIAQEGYLHAALTIAQYRDILNRLLGGDTTPAFAAACWPPGLFGNSYLPAPACIPPATPTIGGTPTPVP